ncbi:MAG: phage tail tape measure protein [Ahrensia sp.]|nr:phage tail tape measure protein [Ahrensia sp.]
MNETTQPITVPVKADMSAFTGAFRNLQRQTERFGSKFAGTMKSAIDRAVSLPEGDGVSGIATTIEDLQKLTERFGSVFVGTISSAIRSGKSFEDTLKSIALRLSDMALSVAVKPLEKAAGGLVQSLFSAIVPSATSTTPTALPSLAGAVPTPSFRPYAKGGVIGVPTFFQSGQQLGLLGEAGAEAIMPLARDGSGRLGVRSSDMGGAGVNITFNVSTPDVAGFKRSEGQISAMLARSVARSRRTR